MTNSVQLHRVLKTSAEKIYQAFLTPAALERWLPPYGFLGKVHHLDARESGTFRMSFFNFGSQKEIAFGGRYLELKKNSFLRYTDTFDDPALPGEITVSVSLQEILGGTEIAIVQEGIPDVIPVGFCYLGWQESLAQLANLVEPNIPD
jgi:uncharacterized protein YndB with AHSA1/START domain